MCFLFTRGAWPRLMPVSCAPGYSVASAPDAMPRGKMLRICSVHFGRAVRIALSVQPDHRSRLPNVLLSRVMLLGLLGAQALGTKGGQAASSAPGSPSRKLADAPDVDRRLNVPVDQDRGSRMIAAIMSFGRWFRGANPHCAAAQTATRASGGVAARLGLHERRHARSRQMTIGFDHAG